MKVLLSFFLSSFVLGSFSIRAQKIIDHTITRASYTYSSKTEHEQKDFAKSDLFFLDIGRNSTKFYSWNEHVRDSITRDALNKKYSVSELNKLRKLYPKGDNTICYQFYNQNKTIVTSTFVSLGFMYEESMVLPRWSITNEKKEILGYPCIKATCKYLGRDWIVYFTPLIPINKGPWKLWGLPGLIIHANDSLNLFLFELKGFKKLNNFPIVYNHIRNNGVDYKKINKNDFIKYEKLYYNDFFAFIKLTTGKEPVREDGQPNPKMSINYIPIEKQ